MISMSFVCTQFKCQIVLFDPTTLGQSGPGSDSNEGVLCISQSSCITGASTSHCLMSCPEHSLSEFLSLCRDAVGIFYIPPHSQPTGQIFAGLQLHA